MNADGARQIEPIPKLPRTKYESSPTSHKETLPSI